MAGRILIVDDDPGFSRAMGRQLARDGHDVTTGATGGEARTLFEDIDPDVVILDYQLPDADGLALLDELRPRAPGTVFLMATAYPDVDVAVEAMRRGAFDYVAKGSDIKECLMRIERAVEVASLRRRMAEASRSTRGGDGEDDLGLTGQSSPMRDLRERLEALAEADDTTVLILGETGTGKGVVARAIHAMSGRAYEPFVAVDCTTIPATLVESELFGHEKGAFSGATGVKTGRVEAAGQGTLFLDEIGELDLSVQAKLLRLLEEREFTRVGGTRTRTLGARVITATNRDLEREVADGRFRADLRYRLEVFRVDTPPLRERGDDLFLLTAQFVAERVRALGRREPRLSAKVIEWLPRYPFPGNIRELRNMVEQAVLLAKGDELTLDEFPVLNRMASGWRPSWPTRSQFSDRPTAPLPGSPAAPEVGGAELRLGDQASTPGLAGTSEPSSAGLEPPAAATGSAAPPAARAEPGGGSAPVARADGPDAQQQGAESLEVIRQRAAERERRTLVEALEATGGNVAAAARRLGLSRYQALRRLKKHGLR